MKKGFTLIELLVVVLIIGILSVVALPQYQKAVKKTRLSEMHSTLVKFKQMAEVFYLTNSSYPTSWSDLDITIPACQDSGGMYDLYCKNFSIDLNDTNMIAWNGTRAPDSPVLVGHDTVMTAYFDKTNHSDAGKIICIGALYCPSFCGSDHCVM